MIPRTWIIGEAAPDSFVAATTDTPPVVAHVAWNRGLKTANELAAFIDPQYDRLLPDPFTYRQMRTAVDRIVSAIQKGERITVYGDYDADGVTSTVIMVEVLTALGANVHWYVPERLTEGYGLHTSAVELLQGQGTQLLITVDCGTTNIAEIARANELGMDIIVLDHHHEPATVPEAVAIINPVFSAETYPFKNHSSGGVTFTVARALLQATDHGQKLGIPLGQGWEKWLLDLAAISTVTDMMVLRGENRVLVKYGLKVLRKTRRPGLRSLFSVMGSDIATADEYSIGFQIGPRLNAAGRLMHASLAVELLLTKDADRGYALALELQRINSDRQQLTEMAVTEAWEQIERQGERGAYAAYAPHWSPGILGLVAGRLVERLWRPVVVMSENAGKIVGSGRSIPGYDIMAALDTGQEYFDRFGGHPGACGFTLATPAVREKFQNWFNDHATAALQGVTMEKPLFIDARASVSDFTPAALNMLDLLGPYGMEHPRPSFLLEGVELQSIATAGADGRHLRLTGSQGGGSAKFIGFRFGEHAATLRPRQRLDIVVEASWNEWNGRRDMQMKIVDLRPSV